MKLTSNQIKVIEFIQFRARASMPQLAKHTGLREHTVRYTLKKLVDNEILKPWVAIDTFRLGYFEFGLFFKRVVENQASREGLVNFLTKTPNIGGVSEYAGDIHYGILFYCRKLVELDYFFDQINEACPGYFSERWLANRMFWEALPSKLIQQRSDNISRLGAKVSEHQERIDVLDHAILLNLAEAPMISTSLLARKLSEPVSTIDNRIRSLERKGVIKGFAYWINSMNFGSQMFRCFLTSKISCPSRRKDFINFCREHPNITGIARSIGSWDYELRVEAREPRDIARLTHLISDKFYDHIDSIKTVQLIENLKISLYPFKNIEASPHVEVAN